MEYIVRDFPVDSLKLTAIGFGQSSLLITDNEIMKAKTKQDKEELHAINRRTQLKVMAKE